MTVQDETRGRVPATIHPAFATAADLIARAPETSSLTTSELQALVGTYESCLDDLLDKAGAIPLRKRFHYLQALEDAISYRRARVAEPCADCDPANLEICDDHGRDADLIAEYEKTLETLCVI